MNKKNWYKNYIVLTPSTDLIWDLIKKNTPMLFSSDVENKQCKILYGDTIVKAIPNKIFLESNIGLNFKSYYRSVVIKPVLKWHQDRTELIRLRTQI